MGVSLQMLEPVVAMAAWSMVMWVWMYATRLPAIHAEKMRLDPNMPRGEQMSKLPPRVRWKADNYNHLMEQPTVFYALAISIALIGLEDSLSIIAAWSYVILRVLHSLFQALINKIEIRFVLFALSAIPLFILTVNAAIALAQL